jgi:AcrR family transcriptional regulator
MAMASSRTKASGTKPAQATTPRDAIIEVAVKLFSEHGYTGTTMRDIATAVGMLPGSLYAHIDSKETLLVDIVEQGIARFLAIETSLQSSTGSPAERLRLAIKSHIAEAAENPERTLVVFHQWRFLSEPNRAGAAAMRQRYALTYTKLVTEGVQQGEFSEQLDIRIAVFSILGSLNWTPEWYSPTGPYSADEIGEKMADFLIGGMLRAAPTKEHSPVATDVCG